jgi:predicted transcriptional regulator
MSRGIKGRSSPNSLIKEATAKLDRADFDKLAEFARNTGRRRGAIVREAIQEYLRQQSQTDSAA